jgi:hypothetical protein
MARGAVAGLLQYWQIALMTISSASRSPLHYEISREFACAIKRMVIVLLFSLEHLHSWFTADPTQDPAAVNKTTLAQRGEGR